VSNLDDPDELVAAIDMLLREQRRGPRVSEEHGLAAMLAAEHADPGDPIRDFRAAARRGLHPAQSIDLHSLRRADRISRRRNRTCFRLATRDRRFRSTADSRQCSFAIRSCSDSSSSCSSCDCVLTPAMRFRMGSPP
jgi:hypothetical protein